MKEIFKDTSPQFRAEFSSKTTPQLPEETKPKETPKYETPKVTFPDAPIRTNDNTRRNENGKNKQKRKKPKGQYSLWPS